MLTVKLGFAIIEAFGLHQTYEPSKILGERWGGMFREAIGAIFLWPAVLLVRREIPRDGDREEDYDKQFSIAYALILLFFGTGVLLGHLFDRVGGGE